MEATASRLARSRPSSVEAVRAESQRLAGFGAGIGHQVRELERYLHENLYEHPKVVRMSQRAERIIGDLFHAYRRDAALLPDHVRALFEVDGEARAIADYIAGMTDRFAEQEHARRAESR